MAPFDGANLDPKALAFNGIDPHHPFREALPEREALDVVFKPIRAAVKASGCKRAILVGHNAFFDLSFLNAAVERCAIKRNPFHPFSNFDTVTLAAIRDDAWKIVAVCIYGGTLILLYLFSTLYHSLRGTAKRVFRVLDHQAIYLLIAGTYTPFALVTLRDSVGWWLFGINWGLAVLGIVLDAIRRDGRRIIPVLIYVVMGWMILVAMEPLRASLPEDGFGWLLAGGLFYTVGILFYVLDHWYKWSHGIWHLFVLAGSALAHAGSATPVAGTAPLQVRVTLTPQAADGIAELGLEVPVTGRVYVILTRDGVVKLADGHDLAAGIGEIREHLGDIPDPDRGATGAGDVGLADLVEGLVLAVDAQAEEERALADAPAGKVHVAAAESRADVLDLDAIDREFPRIGPDEDLAVGPADELAVLPPVSGGTT